MEAVEWCHYILTRMTEIKKAQAKSAEMQTKWNSHLGQALSISIFTLGDYLTVGT